MKIHLHIESLSLPWSHAMDRDSIGRSIEEELNRRIALEGLPQGLRGREAIHLDAEKIELRSDVPRHRVGAHIADQLIANWQQETRE